MDESLLERLVAYAAGGVRAMHMPGHKRNIGAAGYLAALGARLDITEIDGFDDLHDPNGILKEAMDRAARLWGSERAFFLVNGSTSGILAGIRAAARPGGAAIVARNCHRAVFHALELTELDAAWVLPTFDPASGLLGSIQPEAVEEALAKNPDARLVIVTSPTYDGAISDITGICRAAHARGAVVLVDEAHGAHLGFSGCFPGGAVAAGADIVVQSLHKTLPSLTQTAILHAGGLADPEGLQAQLDVFQTASPSYLLMASIDGCVRLVERDGANLFDRWASQLTAFDRAARDLKRISLPGRGAKSPAMHAFDQSKIVISTRGTDLNGPALMRTLRSRYKIELEMASCDYALAMTGLAEPDGALPALAEALVELDRECGAAAADPGEGPFLPERIMPIPRALSMEREMVPLRAAAGRVSAQYAWAYPPGIPLIAPGERVDECFLEAARRLALSGIALRGGPAEGMLWALRQGASPPWTPGRGKG